MMGRALQMELVGTAEDLAAKLGAFASDGIVVKHIIEFTNGASAASGPATEHT